MNHLTDQSVAEYKKIIREDYGVDLNDHQARESAEQMVQFALHILPQPKAAQ